MTYNSIDFIKDFYSSLYLNLTFSIGTTEEVGLMKLACNSFYAVKVQYFTEIYLLCEKLNISYENVKNSMLKNNFINPMHTSVPGHDGMISFGGACFPKDISALNQFMIQNDVFNGVIDSTIIERNLIRKD
jgi:UDP-glucose 6-dehydrogenase